MNLDSFITSCRNPRRIKNRDDKEIVVPCGNCVDCFERKAIRGADWLNKNMLEHKYNVFVTLTYSLANVPTMVLIQHHDGVSCQDATERPMKTKGKRGDYKKVSVNYGKRLYFIPGLQMADDRLFIEFYRQAHSYYGKPFDDKEFEHGCYTLRYIDNSDFQRFIKRLRFQIRSEMDADISYFAVSEYGPRSFSPHFHAVISFDDQRLSECIGEYIDKCWKYGRVDTSFAHSGSACGNYVASYCNSVLSLPYYLNFKSVKPRSFHSQSSTRKINKVIRDYLFAHPHVAKDEFDFYFNGDVYKWFPTRHNINTLFPRCYNYGGKDIESRRSLYTLYPRLQEKTALCKCSDITKYIIQHEPYILRQLDIFPERDFSRMCDQRALCIDYFKHHCLDDYSITIYNRVYSAVALSRRFVEDICTAEYPFEYVFGLITKYYDELPLYMLKKQYESMIEYEKQTGLTNFDIFYWWQTADSHGNLITPTDFYSYLYNHSYIKSAFARRDARIFKKIKKKELNDRNIRFVEPLN